MEVGGLWKLAAVVQFYYLRPANPENMGSIPSTGFIYACGVGRQYAGPKF